MEIARFDVGNPRSAEMAVSADGTRVAVVSTLNHSITIYEFSPAGLEKRHEFYRAYPLTTCWSTSGHLLVSFMAPCTIEEFTASGVHVRTLLQSPGRIQAMAVYGDLLYAHCVDQGIVELRISTGVKLRTLNGTYSLGTTEFRLSPNGRNIVFSVPITGTLCLYDLQSEAATGEIGDLGYAGINGLDIALNGVMFTAGIDTAAAFGPTGNLLAFWECAGGTNVGLAGNTLLVLESNGLIAYDVSAFL